MENQNSGWRISVTWNLFNRTILIQFRLMPMRERERDTLKSKRMHWNCSHSWNSTTHIQFDSIGNTVLYYFLSPLFNSLTVKVGISKWIAFRVYTGVTIYKGVKIFITFFSLPCFLFVAECVCYQYAKMLHHISIEFTNCYNNYSYVTLAESDERWSIAVQDD